MGRQTEDGHEGYVAFVFADGLSGGAWSGGPIATTTADGKPLGGDEWQHRADADVVAWRAVCSDLDSPSGRECWRGPVWTRVASAAEQDLTQRRIYSTDSMLPGGIENAIMLDWELHIAPTAGTYAVELAADEVSQAQDRLAQAVLEARERGASWEEIGRAAGMTRQSAHERWAKLTR
ncbi:hypothetical protein [Nocardia tengchongensis]|uniref:hypothetical protein n=1 Tax=Nocardia tengchongensis TaxID=2055889 RepID=UPI0036BFFF03